MADKQTLSEKIGRVLTQEEQDQIARQIIDLANTIILRGIGKLSVRIGMEIKEKAEGLITNA